MARVSDLRLLTPGDVEQPAPPDPFSLPVPEPSFRCRRPRKCSIFLLDRQITRPFKTNAKSNLPMTGNSKISWRNLDLISRYLRLFFDDTMGPWERGGRQSHLSRWCLAGSRSRDSWTVRLEMRSGPVLIANFFVTRVLTRG